MDFRFLNLAMQSPDKNFAGGNRKALKRVGIIKNVSL